MTPFKFHHRVLFQHCDPAGMVFYPRYFEMINACVETWFEQEVGVPFNKMHLELSLSLPTVATETQFHAPSHLGDRLIFQMEVRAFGNTSLQLNISASCDEQLRLTNETTLALVEQKNGRPTPWSKHSIFNKLTDAYS